MRKLLLSLLFFAIAIPFSFAVTKTLSTGTTWTTATWFPAGAPAVGDDVVIPSSMNLTINTNVTCNSFTLGTNVNGTPTLAISTGFVLSVTNNLDVNPFDRNRQYNVDVNGGTLFVGGSILYPATGTSTVQISTGTLTVNNLLFLSARDRLTFTDIGIANLNGGLTDDAGSLTLVAGCTVRFGGIYTVNPPAFTWVAGSNAVFAFNSTIVPNATLTFANLTINSGVTLITSGNFSVGGNWTNNGGSFTGGTNTITFTGTANTIGGSATTAFPNVVIASGANYTLTNSLSNIFNSLTFAAGNTNSSLNFSGAETLAINTTLNLNQPTANTRNHTLNINAGTVTVSGLISFLGNNTTISRIGRIVITTGTLNANGGITFTAGAAATKVIDMSAGAGNLNLRGALTVPANSSTLTAGTLGSIFNYYDSNPQTINLFSAGAYHNLHINNIGTATLSANLTTLNLTGNLRVQTGKLAYGGTVSVLGNASRIFELAPNTIFQITAGGVFPIGFGTYTFAASSLTQYHQNLASLVQPIGTPGYGFLQVQPSVNGIIHTFQAGTTFVQSNLTIGNGTNTGIINTTATASAINVTGDVTINANATFVSSLSIANPVITIFGNWINNGGTHQPGLGTTIFSGANQSITKVAGETFGNLTLAGSGTKTLGGAVTCNGSLLISTGVTFDVTASNHGLFIKQNYTNNGSLLTQQGTVTFNGTIVQSIGGSSLTNFYNMASSNGSVVNIAAPQNLINTLTITTGTFATNNIAFTLLSNATNTANIAAIPTGANITGNIIMQRFTPGGKTGWAMLGSPVLGQTLANWKDDFAMSGFAGSNQPSNPFKSVYTYNETTLGTYSLGYVAATSTANAISSGVGYYAYVGTAFTNTADINIDMIGVPFVGSFTYGVNYTTSSGGINNDGWNMLANPYPSALDWESANWTRTNLNNTIYTYNADIGQYVTYSVGGMQTNGGTRYIPSSQAFWVKATGASPVLRSTENVKSNAQPVFLRDGEAIVHDIESVNIKITNASYTDETVIAFKNNATKEFDEVYDAHKFQTNLAGAPTIASQIGSNIFAVNVRPKINQLDTIDIKVLVPTTTVYTLTIPKTVLNDSLYCLLLRDKHTNTIMSVDTSLSYVFTATDTTQFSRFQLIVQKPFSVSVTEASCANSNQVVSLSSSLIGVYSYTITNSGGNQVLAAQTAATTNLTSLTNDSYNVLFTNQIALCPSLSDSIFIKNFTKAESAAALAITDLDLLITNNSTNAVSYNWNFGDTQTSQLPEPSHQYQNASTYTVTLEAISIDGCSSISTYSVVATEVVTTPVTTITGLQNNLITQLQLIVKDDKVELSVMGNEVFTNLTAEIIDITGKTVKRNIINQLKQGENQYINLLDVPASVYLVRVYNSSILKQIKIATIK
ncbi:MAG: PKD domain-containing protein [Bacteroidota bacterium]